MHGAYCIASIAEVSVETVERVSQLSKPSQPTTTVSLSRNLYSGISILVGAGPFRMRPDASKWDPWHGQKNPPGISPALGIGMQPRCVQIPITISHSGLFVLSLSLWGSRNFATFTSCSCSMMDSALKCIPNVCMYVLEADRNIGYCIGKEFLFILPMVDENRFSSPFHNWHLPRRYVLQINFNLCLRQNVSRWRHK